MNTPPSKIPQHVAIIMDGNGRWAKGRGEERLEGHSRGVDSVRAVVKAAADIGVKYLTIYAFSTENWGRPTQEVDGIMELLTYTITSELEQLTRNGVKMHFIGELETMPENLRQTIRKAQNYTPDTIILNLVIALNYSARWEITQACRAIATMVQEHTLTPDQITEQTVCQSLSTAAIPDPELLIRTSGEERLSNFLLWQLSYTELYFTSTLWPDFDGKAFMLAIEDYGRRERRFGRVTNR